MGSSRKGSLEKRKRKRIVEWLYGFHAYDQGTWIAGYVDDMPLRGEHFSNLAHWPERVVSGR